MRIALISYECPPETADGGIGTYTWHAAQALNHIGMDVEIFSASRNQSSCNLESGIKVHRVMEQDVRNFKNTIRPVFFERHSFKQFDVIEGPDYNADAIEIMQHDKRIASVTKLHTPRKLIFDIVYKRKHIAGRIKSVMKNPGNWSTALKGYGSVSENLLNEILTQDELEKQVTITADLVVSPSQALATYVKTKWQQTDTKVLPYPFYATKEYLQISNQPGEFITFLGRLDHYKGYFDFVEAIKYVEQAHPNCKIRIVGSSQADTKTETSMREYATTRISNNIQLEFTGRIPKDSIASVIAEASVVVIPSHWDNFPFVVMESMAAARTIIATSVGGIPYLLGHGEAGILVKPSDPKALGIAISNAIGDTHRLSLYGQQARDRILTICNPKSIAERQVTLYKLAIDKNIANNGDAKNA